MAAWGDIHVEYGEERTEKDGIRTCKAEGQLVGLVFTAALSQQCSARQMTRYLPEFPGLCRARPTQGRFQLRIPPPPQALVTASKGGGGADLVKEAAEDIRKSVSSTSKVPDAP